MTLLFLFLINYHYVLRHYALCFDFDHGFLL